MNCWQLLDINPTDDIRIIKRAYAGKTKLYHPEDDPQGFQRLREAYELALKGAKWRNKNKATTVQKEGVLRGSDAPCEQESLPPVEIKKIVELVAEKKHTLQKCVEEFMCRATKIYEDEKQRNDVQQWKALLEDEDYWNLDVKQKLNYTLLSFLLEREEYTEDHKTPTLWNLLSHQFTSQKDGLSTQVWHLLNTHFFWSEQEKELYRIYPEKFLRQAMGRIRYKKVPVRRLFIDTAQKYSIIMYQILFAIILIVIGWQLFTVFNYHSGAIGVFVVMLISRAFRG